jgi:hypothetical protein
MVGGQGPRARLADGQPAPPPAAASAGPVPEPEGAENQPKVTGGFLVAWDPKTQKERWRITGVGGFNGGGTLATAGNVLFQGATAYNAATGDKLWSADLGGAYVTPVTYMLDGKQYVTLLGRAYPDNRLFTFVLDGKEPVPALRPAPAR